MSGGRFLVSLREVNTSEKILALNSILKEDINFWEEIICKLESHMEVLSTELYESELSDDSKQVAVTVAGYIANSLTKRSKCSQCKENLVERENDIIHDQYLKLLSRDGLITPSPSLRDFVFQSFNILDITSAMLHKETGNKCIRKVSENYSRAIS